MSGSGRLLRNGTLQLPSFTRNKNVFGKKNNWQQYNKTDTYIYKKAEVKVKQSHYRTGQSLSVPGG